MGRWRAQTCDSARIHEEHLKGLFDLCGSQSLPARYGTTIFDPHLGSAQRFQGQ